MPEQSSHPVTPREALERLSADAVTVAGRDDLPEWVRARAAAVAFEAAELLAFMDCHALGTTA